MKMTTIRRLHLIILSCVLCFNLLSDALAQDVIWRRTLDNDPAQRDTARHMAALTNGDLVVGGQSGPTATRNFIVYRLNGTTGAVMWTRTLDSGFGSDDVNDLIADPATGDTYICGRAGSSGQALNWYVMKINGSDGTNAWAAPYTYNQTNENDEPRALTFVQDGATKNIVVVGMITNSGTPQGRIVKLNASTGALMWGNNVGPQLQAVVTDSSGNIFCGGETFAFNNQATISKFNISGTQQWQQTYAPNSGQFNRWNHIALDAASGDVITGGLNLGAQGDNDICAARYRSSDGAQLWSRFINGTNPAANDSCSSIMVDSGGDVYLTGYYRATSTSADWYAARLNIATGATVWEKTYNGNSTGNEQLENLRVVGSTVYLAGYMTSTAPPAVTAGRTQRVMKLAKADGSTLLVKDFLDRVGPQVVGTKALIVASNGDMIVSGDSAVTSNAAEIARFGSLAPAAPLVTNVTSSTANGAYRTTQSVSIQVTFDASVTVTGNPTLALNSGGSATYASGSPGTTLTFNYTVGAGQTAADLDYSATNSLALAGGTINATTGGTAATLTLPSPGAAGSLGANKAIVIDTTAPALAGSITISDTNLRIGETATVIFTFTDAVSGFTTADVTAPNAVLSSLSSSDGGITWTATLMPNSSVQDSTNVLSVDNTGYTDAVGNAGTGSTNSNNYAIDTLRPTATIVVADTNLSLGETSLVTFTFSEAVTGFTNADLSPANGTLTSVSSSDGGITWTSTFTPTVGITDGTNTIFLDNTGIADVSGNAGSGLTISNNYAINTNVPTSPEIIVTESAANVPDGGSLSFGTTTVGSPVTKTFAVTNSGTAVLNLSALTVPAGFIITQDFASSTVASGGGTTTFQITMTAAAPATPSGSLTFTNDDSDEGAYNFTISGAVNQPNATVQSFNGTVPGPQNGGFISWQIVFDVPVSGLTASNFAIINGGLGGSPAIAGIQNPGGLPSSTTWNISVSTGTGDGTLGVNLANDTGLSHAVTNVLPFVGSVHTIDKTAPTIAIGSPSVSTIAAGAGSVTYTVTYADTNFSASTLSTGNVTLNTTGTANGTVGISGSGTTRTVTLSSISGVGSIGISIASGTATDTAGNTAPAAGPSATFAVTTTTNTEIASTGTVLDASNNLPAGGTLARVFPGVINEDGYISFRALGTVGTGGFTSGNAALMLTNYPAGTLSVIGQQGMLLPDGGALKGGFDNLVLTNAGRSISYDQFSGTTTSKDSGYLIAEGASTAEVLSREGDTPTGGGTFTGHTGRHAADDEERVYFIGALGGVAATKNGGVWYDDAGALSIMVKKGDDVGTLTGDLSWLGTFSAPLSAAGEGAAFITALQNNPSNAAQKTPVAKNAAIFGGAPGALELVARRGDVIPAVGTLNSFSGVSRGSNGDHAFISLLAASTTAPVVSTTNDQVLMAEISGVKHLVARENTTAIIASLSPTRFGSFYMTSTGAVIYQAWLAGAGVTTANDSIICRWTVAGGNEVLAREGDTAPGTTLKYSIFQVLSVSPGGAIALQGTLSSGGFIMRALPGAGFGLVVRSQTNVLVNGTNLQIASLSIHDSGAGTGGGGGGLGAAINDDGAIFTVLTTLDSKYVTRIFEP